MSGGAPGAARGLAGVRRSDNNSNPTGLTLGPGSAGGQCIVGTMLPF